MSNSRNCDYFIINKPYGTLSQFTKEAPHHQVLGDWYDFPKDCYPVGRLDRDSEGLLIISNDSSLNQKLLHPSNKQPKTYWVQIEGRLEDSNLAPLRTGISIKLKSGLHSCLPATCEVLATPEIWQRVPPVRFRKSIPTSWAKISIIEGKNRQLRKMFAAIGFPVLRLIRVSLGKLTIKNLNSGEVQKIKKPIP